jgi:hypothetical protein
MPKGGLANSRKGFNLDFKKQMPRHPEPSDDFEPSSQPNFALME